MPQGKAHNRTKSIWNLLGYIASWVCLYTFGHFLADVLHCLLLGAPQLALDHYRLLNVKQVQNDTMSYLVLSRATNFSLAATGDLTYVSECLESSHVYFSNSQEVSDKSLFSHSVALTVVRLLSSSSRHSARKSTHRQVLPNSQLRTS